MLFTDKAKRGGRERGVRGRDAGGAFGLFGGGA